MQLEETDIWTYDSFVYFRKYEYMFLAATGGEGRNDNSMWMGTIVQVSDMEAGWSGRMRENGRGPMHGERMGEVTMNASIWKW